MNMQQAWSQLDHILTAIVWHFFAIAELEFRRYVHSHLKASHAFFICRHGVGAVSSLVVKHAPL